MTCPKCKSRATKIINANTDEVTCQICGHVWLLPDPREKEKKDLGETEPLECWCNAGYKRHDCPIHGKPGDI